MSGKRDWRGTVTIIAWIWILAVAVYWLGTRYELW